MISHMASLVYLKNFPGKGVVHVMTSSSGIFRVTAHAKFHDLQNELFLVQFIDP